MGEAGVCDAVAVEGVGGAGWLQVHGLPEGAAFDVRFLQFGGEFVAVTAVGDGINEDSAQPEVGIEIRPGVLLNGDTRNVRELLGVDALDATAMCHELMDAGQLPAADARTDVAEAVVVPDFGMPVFVVRVGIPRLRRVELNPGGCLCTGADEGTAAGRGDHFVAVEGEGAIGAEGAAALSLVVRANGFASIFKHGNVVLVGDSHQFVDVGWHAVKINGNDGLGFASRLGNTVHDGFFQQLGIHVPAVRRAVH